MAAHCCRQKGWRTGCYSCMLPSPASLINSNSRLMAQQRKAAPPAWSLMTVHPRLLSPGQQGMRVQNCPPHLPPGNQRCTSNSDFVTGLSLETGSDFPKFTNTLIPLLPSPPKLSANPEVCLKQIPKSVCPLPSLQEPSRSVTCEVVQLT